MPTEYETLVAALKLTDIPFAEYGWKNRPEGTYGVVSLDMENGILNGDDGKLDRTWEASVDVFYRNLPERESVISAVEETLTEVCGSCWELNSMQYENTTGLFHIEWVCQVKDNHIIREITATLNIKAGNYIKGMGSDYYKPENEIWPQDMTVTLSGANFVSLMEATVYRYPRCYIAVTAKQAFTVAQNTDIQLHYVCELIESGEG